MNKKGASSGSRFNALEQLEDEFGGVRDIDILKDRLQSIPNPCKSNESREMSGCKKGIYLSTKAVLVGLATPTQNQAKEDGMGATVLDKEGT